ncbi:hypothetical protein F3Y22_tig00110221pilonHSYRG00331 [Hibiscus syriacus]|uniref:Uncharacterized protein n=1 Tax=Hibiscus syriacus TaxID=106335 RepID=A0A6A3B7J7_HIBSY|nr:hypothetical protein F3Y22_tig00110221pilonHSYRG00331 [Hibiscus syriacus]
MSGGDRCHEHLRHRSERTSPERSLWDYEAPPRPSKRKADQHRDVERDYDRNYDDCDSDRHHHHCSESSKLEPEQAHKLTSTTNTSGTDKKSKPSVFSRISFPEEEISKKQKM